MRRCACSGALLAAAITIAVTVPARAQSATPVAPATPPSSNDAAEPSAAPPNATPPAAPAVDARAKCVTEHEQAQISRMHDALVSARASALSCSQAECPSLLRTDCAEWFAELDRQVPSVVISVRAGSIDVANATVNVDGKPLAQALNGEPVELDPGHHTFEVTPPGRPKLSREVVLASGEKARQLVFELPTEAAPEKSAATSAPASLVTYRPVPIVTWVLAGATVAAAGTGAVFGSLALAKRSDLEQKPASGGCAPYCTNAQVAPVHHLSLTADVFFGVAAASAVGAAVSYWLRPEKPISAGSLRLDFGLAPGSATLGVRGNL